MNTHFPLSALKISARFFSWQKILLISILVIAVSLIIIIRGDFPGARQALARVPGLRQIIQERDAINSRAKLAALNYAIPPFEYLANFIMRPGVFDAEHLRGYYGYIDYYEKIIAVMPQSAEGYGILGFLYDKAGEHDQAITACRTAVSLKPDFFWFSYNLGVLYLRDHHYDLAAQSFALALDSNPTKNLKFLSTSKIYQQIRSTSNFGYDLIQSLKNGYAVCQKLLAVCQRHLSDPQTNEPLLAPEALELKIF